MSDFHETKEIHRGSTSTGEKKVNEYIVEKTLGKGAYAKVKLCRHATTGLRFAMKICNKSVLKKRARFSKDDPMQNILREIAIQKKLSHPNAIRLFEVMDDPNEDKLYMIFEFATDGITMDITDEEVKPMPMDTIYSYTRQLILGLEYLHQQGVIHRDIKPENIMVSEGIVKFGDFGVSQMYSDGDQLIRKTAGTPLFYSPEICAGGEYRGPPVDVWALGATLFCFAFAKTPFTGATQIALMESIVKDPLNFPSDAPETFKDLLNRMMDKNPDTRITLAEMKSHPFVTKNGTDQMAETVHDVIDATEDDINGAITDLSKQVVRMVMIKTKMRNWKKQSQASTIAGLIQKANLQDGAQGSHSKAVVEESRSDPMHE
eukprot:TRINITY_DN1983_c0_g1_i1.p1 TRINITY_DN1983_c0_g1~~TRINITY_DN1983_c0_g1_i1.p1  ORF type:complete len:375 (-),score=96.98 TRINITY_DN1983_c0_g1_i1:184-1308(-)